MIDPDLEKQLLAINANLTDIKKIKSPGIWRSFFNGVFGALGYVAGLALVIVILGWVLQKTGLLQPFQAQIKDFEVFMNDARKLMDGQSGQQGSNNGQTYYITTPDGRKVQVTQ